MKKPACAAVKQEAEEDWGVEAGPGSRTTTFASGGHTKANIVRKLGSRDAPSVPSSEEPRPGL
jgi:hypothetical protein